MREVKAKVKLTAKQQEVVNLMAAGGVLHYSRGMGRFSEASASLKNGDGWHKIAANVPDQLSAKGVVEVDKSKSDWRGCEYVLTTLGASLAKPTDKPTTEVWWSHNLRSAKFVRSTGDWLFDERGTKTAKHTQWEDWYPTREAAVEARYYRLKRDVSSAESALKYAQQALAEFEKQENL